MPHNLDSLDERLNILAVIMQSLMGYRHSIGGAPDELRPALRLCLQFHVMERLLLYDSTAIHRFAKTLASLLDAVGDGFTLWLNFTDSDHDTRYRVMAVLGPDIVDFLSHQLL